MDPEKVEKLPGSTRLELYSIYSLLFILVRIKLIELNLSYLRSVDVSVMFMAKAGAGQKLGKRFTVVPIETKVVFILDSTTQMYTSH